MIAVLAFALATHSADFDFYAFGPYAAVVPRPESILGYGPGERHTTFRDQERVMRGIADGANDRVRVFQYGESTEGRPLRIMVFGKPENILRLNEIREENARIAAGKAQPSDDLPAIVWINECIHGNETASFESGMWLAYTLAASQNPQITNMLDDAIVIVNPVYNPDGHERFVVWYNSISIGHQDPQAVERRGQALQLDLRLGERQLTLEDPAVGAVQARDPRVQRAAELVTGEAFERAKPTTRVEPGSQTFLGWGRQIEGFAGDRTSRFGHQTRQRGPADGPVGDRVLTGQLDPSGRR
ncbi:MAG: hypothetical protein IH848_09115 [Acidobacteria bacterium]|nr:hypothetical protein [Acidobacteriota bacterium]